MSDVPVFNCHVYVSPPDADGHVTARLANLPEIVGRGPRERDALRILVQNFKQAAAGYLAQGQPIPWLTEIPPPGPAEQQRWVPVHL